MIRYGLANFSLDEGRCPKWLFERMVSLGRAMLQIMIDEYGPEEFIKRIADPVWFQALGTVLAFDWNSSGLTTILTAALKEAIRGQEKDLGIFICGGKGKTSRKTPDEIKNWGERLNFSPVAVSHLIYNSKMAAKVDSALVQDGYQIYHHTFFFSQKGSWAVVQQGMNTFNQTARRYHWYSSKITDLVCEPHSGIMSQLKAPTLDLTSRLSEKNRQISLELVQAGYKSLKKDLLILHRHFSKLSQTLALRFKDKDYVLMNLENREFHWHPVLNKDFTQSKYLEKILVKLGDEKPESYEKILATTGVGPKTIRALALVAEVIYGAKPCYEDPARYSFAHGGKDATPYPVDRQTYDETIETMKKAVAKIKFGFSEKRRFKNY